MIPCTWVNTRRLWLIVKAFANREKSKTPVVFSELIHVWPCLCQKMMNDHESRPIVQSSQFTILCGLLGARRIVENMFNGDLCWWTSLRSTYPHIKGWLVLHSLNFIQNLMGVRKSSTLLLWLKFKAQAWQSFLLVSEIISMFTSGPQGIKYLHLSSVLLTKNYSSIQHPVNKDFFHQSGFYLITALFIYPASTYPISL